MDKQEVFDTVKKHLLCQGEASLGNDGVKGLKCAIGCLIPDEEYNLTMENVKVFAINVPALKGIDSSLLQSLQRIHAPSQWALHLEDLRVRYNLL